MLEQKDLLVKTLGKAEYASPRYGGGEGRFVSDETRVRFEDEIGPGAVQGGADLTFEKSGPRDRIFFDPAKTTAAIVTCGGLCPGLNNVIRSAFLELHHNYNVSKVLGIQNGYQGLNPDVGPPPIEIHESFVHHIQDRGGTVLGSSRGPQDPAVMVDFLEAHGIDILFCVGGDGTQRGAHALQQEVERRGLKKSVVGIPKTIDNDIQFVWMTFGYATAISKAEEVLRAAHMEAHGAPNGIGLVKLMGRDSGFIAAGAALASQEANFVLVPEVRFPLEGEGGFLEALERRIVKRGHAMVVVAEGAGQHLFEEAAEKQDASGNVAKQDIGVFLRDRINAHFKERGIVANLKYLDPSYLIRSVPADGWDRILCDRMARHAVHGAMAGKTDMMIGFHHATMINVPIPAATSARRHMELSSDLWSAVLSNTGQPRW
jgi:6-phosphofructokinase 1